MPREQQMEVLERFALGDLEAFEILFREFQGEVYRCTYRTRSWRPVRESNPCRRRERETINCNSKELRGMDSTLPQFKELTGTLNGRLTDAH